MTKTAQPPPDQQRDQHEDHHDAVVAEALNALKTWWETPHTATGEEARLDAAVVALKRLRGLGRQP